MSPKDEEKYKWPFWIMITIWGISLGLFCWLAREVIANDRTNTKYHSEMQNYFYEKIENFSKANTDQHFIIMQKLSSIETRLGMDDK
jgi:uncharacterized membrane protein (DUF106 family)